MPNLEIEPALKVIREHREVAKRELERVDRELKDTRAEIDAAKARAEQLIKDHAQFTAEFRAHERVLQHLMGGMLH